MTCNRPVFRQYRRIGGMTASSRDSRQTGRGGRLGALSVLLRTQHLQVTM